MHMSWTWRPGTWCASYILMKINPTQTGVTPLRRLVSEALVQLVKLFCRLRHAVVRIDHVLHLWRSPLVRYAATVGAGSRKLLVALPLGFPLAQMQGAA